MPEDDSADPRPTAAPSASELAVPPLAELRGRGEDPSGNVQLELDGTGRLVSVQISSLAMSGTAAALEQSIQDAFAAAFTEVEAQRASLAPTALLAGNQRLSALTTELQDIQDAAARRLDEALSAIAAAAGRMAR